MLDCGLAARYKLVRSGIIELQVSHLFFTHHHSDHDAYYASFLLTRFDMYIGKDSTLKVYRPPPAESLTEKLIGENQGAYWHNFVASANHPISLWAYRDRGGRLPRPIPEVTVKDIHPGKMISGPDWTIEYARVEHGQPYLDSLVCRVNTNNGTIVF